MAVDKWTKLYENNSTQYRGAKGVKLPNRRDDNGWLKDTLQGTDDEPSYTMPAWVNGVTAFIGTVLDKAGLSLEPFSDILKDEKKIERLWEAIGKTHGDKSVVEAHLADRSVTADKLANDAVTTRAIEDLAVTRERIAEGAITSSRVRKDAITKDGLRNGAVITDKIANDAVTADKLNPNAADGIRDAAVGVKGVVALASDADVANKVSPRNDVVLTPRSHKEYQKSFFATETERGLIELATKEEVADGSENNHKKAITPYTLHQWIPKEHKEGTEKATRLNYSFQHLLEDDFTLTGSTEYELASNTYIEIGGRDNEYSLFRVMIEGIIPNLAKLKKWEGKEYAAWEFKKSPTGDDTKVDNQATNRANTLFGALRDTLTKSGGDWKMDITADPTIRLVFQKESSTQWKTYLGVKYLDRTGTYWYDDTYTTTASFSQTVNKGTTDKDEFPFFDHPYAISDDMMYYDAPSRKAQSFNTVFPQVLLAEHIHDSSKKQTDQRDFFTAIIPEGSTIMFMCAINDRGADSANYSRRLADGRTVTVHDHTETYTLTWVGHVESTQTPVVLSSKYVNSQAELVFSDSGQPGMVLFKVHLRVNTNKAGTAKVQDDDWFEFVRIEYLGTAEHEHP